MCCKNRKCSKKSKKSKKHNQVQKVNSFVLAIVYSVFRVYVSLCGVRTKHRNKIGKPQAPAIILCNHGSFIDFIYAADVLKKYKPNFVIARLYFYNRITHWMLHKVGGFPKSMFAMDPESTKNCLRVLRGGGILAMMPEARLSTHGRFEDIQENTYSFLKKCAVPVYTLKFRGDYLADPKWGKGFRRGALVETEFDLLFTAEDIEKLTVEEIKQGVEQRLDYNDFQWLQERPQVHYRTKNLAEGLENILTTCPHCRQKYTLTTAKNKIFCEKCGELTAMDDRYQFSPDFQFRDLTGWYDWQKELLEAEIARNPDYKLTSAVELRLPGDGKGMTRCAGQGVCTLDRQGLHYRGTKDGETVEVTFPISQVYRLLFGAGVNFEIYNGTEIWFFVPPEKRSCVQWYMASMILHDEAARQKHTQESPSVPL